MSDLDASETPTAADTSATVADSKLAPAQAASLEKASPSEPSPNTPVSGVNAELNFQADAQTTQTMGSQQGEMPFGNMHV
jgi:hypothetical protein